ncbi:ectoine synthase [Mesorhizobium sp. M0643]|uniref:ectoine synthase n=1 Tax=Mesorhizobium sp. M0643 TaxID=2956978 RepID=UPI0033360DE3
MHYKDHLESVYCIEGTGTIEHWATSEIHPIRAVVDYARQARQAYPGTDAPMIIACVFNRPVTGNEVH